MLAFSADTEVILFRSVSLSVCPDIWLLLLPGKTASGETMNIWTWDDVCLNAVDRSEWKEWTARCASHWRE